MSRNAKLAAGLVTVILATTVGWVAGKQVKSPAEIAATTAAPAASNITIPVEKLRLSSEVTARGTVRFGAPRSVLLPGSALKSARTAANSVVTATPNRGAVIKEGAVALAVSGRPVFVLEGDSPSHRDLVAGTVGDDVRQLERGLARLGFSPGQIDGVFDASTSSAVASWYVASSRTPFGPTEEQLQALRAAQTDVFAVQSELLVAREAVLAAESARRAAAERLRAARVVVTPAGQAAGRAKRESERLAADAEVTAKSNALKAAQDDAKVATARLAEARAGTPVPTSAADLATLQSTADQAATAVTSAQADVTAAKATLEAVKASGTATIATKQAALAALLAASPQDAGAIAVARTDVTVATADAETARLVAVADVSAKQGAVDTASAAKKAADAALARGQAGTPRVTTAAETAALEAAVRQSSDAVVAARAGLDSARAAVRALTAAAAVTANPRTEAAVAESELAQATQAVTLARQRVALLDARGQRLIASSTTGPLDIQVPADELVFLPNLPVRVDEVKLKVGDQVNGPVMTVTNATLVIDSALSAADAKLVRRRAAVAINAPDLGVRAKGVVTEVATTPGTRGVDPQRFFVEVSASDVPPTLVGVSVVMTITVSTTGSEVLAVPASALSVAADGRSRVQVQVAQGDVREVTVTPGLAAKGLVAITPSSGSLSAGDLVVVGAK